MVPSRRMAGMAALLVLAAGLTAMATAPAAKPVSGDFSDPKKAVASLVAALQAQDLAASRNALVIGPEDKADVDALLDLMSSAWELQKAAQRVYSSADADKFFGGKTTGEQLQKRLDNALAAEVHVEGDAATITLKADDSIRQPGGTLALKKSGEDWKLDAAALLGLAGTSPEARAQRIALAVKSAAITRQAARDVAARKFASAAEAYEAYWSHIADAVNPATPPATSPGGATPAPPASASASAPK